MLFFGTRNHNVPQEAPIVAASALYDGPHRRNRVDTLESYDGEGIRGQRGFTLKTYEQLRSLHPERGHHAGENEYSLEQ